MKFKIQQYWTEAIGQAENVSALDALIAAESAKEEALKNHKKGLMQQMFPNN